MATSHLLANHESYRRMTVSDTTRNYALSQHSPEQVSAFRELLVKVIAVINDPSITMFVDCVTAIPKEVKDRNLHWLFPKANKVMMATWLEMSSADDISLIVEKFFETSTAGATDDIWRVSCGTWSVTFIGVMAWDYHNISNKLLAIDRIDLLKDRNNIDPYRSVMHDKRIHSGTMFSMTGDLDHLVGDALQWKLAK